MILRYNIFTLAWALLIISLSLTPGKNMPELSVWNIITFDKVAHAFVYCIFVLLAVIGLKKQHSYMKLRFNALFYAFLAGFLLSFIIELIQIYVPGRSFELLDIVANTFGCSMGLVLFYFIYKF